MKLSNSFSSALRTFAYFMASGTHYNLEGIDYSDIFQEPSVVEKVFAIFANVIEMDEEGTVLNVRYATERATDYIRSYYDSSFEVQPPYEDWEIDLY